METENSKHSTILAALFLIAAVVLGIGVGGIKCFTHYTWGDEVLTLWIASPSWSAFMNRVFSGVDGQLPLVYLVYWIGLHVGINAEILRLVMLLAMYFGICLLALYLLRVGYNPTGIVLGIALTLSLAQGLNLTASDLRGYSVYLLSAIGTLVCVSALDAHPTLRRTIITGAIMGVFLNTHPFAAAFSGAIVSLAFFRFGLRGYFQEWLIMTSIAGLMWVPALPAIWNAWSLGTAPWFGTVAMRDIPQHIFIGIAPLSGLACAVILLILPRLCKMRSKPLENIILVYSIAILVTWACLVIYSSFSPMIIPRYLIPVVAANIVVLSYIFSRFSITPIYIILCFLASLGIEWKSKGNPWSNVIKDGQTQAAVFVGANDSHILKGKTMFIGADTGTLLPRIHHNLHSQTYLAITENPKNTRETLHTDDIIIDRLINQGYPICRVSAKEAASIVEDAGFDRVVLFANRVPVSDGHGGFRKGSIFGAESQVSKLVRELKGSYSVQEVFSGGIKQPMWIFDRIHTQ